MQFHEQVYTSAKRLLDTQEGNLGIVARSKGFPSELEYFLAAHRSYSILERLPVDQPTRHPPRFVVQKLCKDRSYYCISRVAFAGADHTGRTAPIAHQLVFPVALMEAEGNQPSCVLRALSKEPNVFQKTWNSAPVWYDPPHVLTVQDEFPASPNGKWASLSSEATVRRLLTAVADGLLQFRNSGRPVVLCVPLETAGHLLGLASDIWSLIPESIQYEVTFASHVVTASDCVRGASLLTTYSDTPFWIECLHRQDVHRPVLFNICTTELPATWNVGDYGAAIESEWNGYGFASLESIPRIWDDLGFTNDKARSFREFAQLRHDLDTVQTGEEVSDAANRLATLPDSPSVIQAVTDLVVVAVRRLGEIPIPQRWDSLAKIVADHRWPSPSRLAAWQAISEDGALAVGHVLQESQLSLEQDTVLQPMITAFVAEHPKLLDDVIARAATNDNRNYRVNAIELLAKATIDSRFALSLLRRAIELNPSDEWTEMHGRLTKTAVNSLNTCDELNNLTVYCVRLNDGIRKHFAPLLIDRMRSLLARSNDEKVWNHIVQNFAKVSCCCGNAAEQLRWLCSVRPERITDAHLEIWYNNASETQKAVVEAVVQEFRTKKSPPPLPAESDSSGIATELLQSSDAFPSVRKKPGTKRKGGVGPVGMNKFMSRLLVVLAAIIAVIQFGLYKNVPTQNLANSYLLLLLSSIAGVFVWASAELILQFTIKDPQKLWVARVTRRTLFCLFVTLNIALVVLACLYLMDCFNLIGQFKSGTT